MDLFNQSDSGAIFSNDKAYRYILWRIWNNKQKKLMFIGLNPSTGNKYKNDNTINRIRGLSFKLGYGGFYMLNLFTYITPYPQDLLKCDDPVGPADRYILDYINKSDKIIACWGSFKEAKKRSQEVISMIDDVYCLGINKNNTPLHPLYSPSEPILIKYK